VDVPGAQNFPHGQSRHELRDVLPLVMLYVPAGHSVHVSPAPPAEYVPGGHIEPIEPNPGFGQYWPGGQVVDVEAPGIGQIPPIGH